MKALKKYHTNTRGVVLLLALIGLITCVDDVHVHAGDNNTMLLDRISQIRSAPYDYALSMGYDPLHLETVGVMPETRFSSYVPDDSLRIWADGATAQMAGDTEDLSSDMTETLYTAETGAVISFANFMTAEAAAEIFLENLFRSEIDSGRFQFLLSDEYIYAGVSVRSGVMEDQTAAWFFSLVLGSSVRTSEIQLLNMINQVRSNPWSVQAYIDMDLLSVFNGNWDAYYLMDTALTPVFFDASLYAAVKAFAAYLLSGLLTAPLTPDMSPLEAASVYGYTGTDVVETLTSQVDDGTATAALPAQLFSDLVLGEMATWPLGAVLFSGDAHVAAPALMVKQRPNSNLTLCRLYVGNAAVEVEDSDAVQANIYGIAFSDDDCNGFYNPGEEIPGETVKVSGKDGSFATTVATDKAGHFALGLEPGRDYVFETQFSGEVLTREAFVTGDQFLTIIHTPSLQQPSE